MNNQLSFHDRVTKEIPPWKRFFICQILRRKLWKVARAHNIVAAHHVFDDYEIFQKMVDEGDKIWAEVYGGFLPESEK
jgi:hypothetical protein